nr:hypothetical protein [Pseudomonas moraviensis]
MAEEGATQGFFPERSNDIILGAVGVLQFDVKTWGLFFAGCISVSAGVAAGGFALTASHLFQTPECRPSKKVTQKACSCVRPSQARVPSLRD